MNEYRSLDSHKKRRSRDSRALETPELGRMASAYNLNSQKLKEEVAMTSKLAGLQVKLSQSKREKQEGAPKQSCYSLRDRVKIVILIQRFVTSFLNPTSHIISYQRGYG